MRVGRSARGCGKVWRAGRSRFERQCVEFFVAEARRIAKSRMKCQSEQPAFVVAWTEGNHSAAHVEKRGGGDRAVFQNQNLAGLLHDKKSSAAIVGRHQIKQRGAAGGVGSALNS